MADHRARHSSAVRPAHGKGVIMLAFASSTNVSQSIFVPPNMLPKRRIAASSSGRHEAWFALALASDTVHCFFAPMDRYVGAAARFAASFADIAHEEGAA